MIVGGLLLFIPTLLPLFVFHDPVLTETSTSEDAKGLGLPATVAVFAHVVPDQHGSLGLIIIDALEVQVEAEVVSLKLETQNHDQGLGSRSPQPDPGVFNTKSQNHPKKFPSSEV